MLFQVTFLGGEVECGAAAEFDGHGGEAGPGWLLQQDLHDAPVPALRRFVERREAPFVCDGDVDVRLYQRLHLIKIPLFCRVQKVFGGVQLERDAVVSAQKLVCSADQLKDLGRLRIVLVFVGVEADGKPPVCVLDRSFTCILSDSQKFCCYLSCKPRHVLFPFPPFEPLQFCSWLASSLDSVVRLTTRKNLKIAMLLCTTKTPQQAFSKSSTNLATTTVHGMTKTVQQPALNEAPSFHFFL
mmetsp:Transcript_49422/g.117299  ORF Transcript_49422/g.117299 Transcript_49422/m.117299 type:complete len:242 (-) Transcript_49422:129-854(-)